MATRFNTQVGNGEYRLQFETDNKEYYLLMQSTARRCVDCVHNEYEKGIITGLRIAQTIAEIVERNCEVSE